jgi:hypothetical protein
VPAIALFVHIEWDRFVGRLGWLQRLSLLSLLRFAGYLECFVSEGLMYQCTEELTSSDIATGGFWIGILYQSTNLC